MICRLCYCDHNMASNMFIKIALWLVLALCFFLFLITSAKIELQRFEHPISTETKKDEPLSLSFLVIGDWGRRGAFNQSQVASQVTKHYIFITLTGFFIE